MKQVNFFSLFLLPLHYNFFYFLSFLGIYKKFDQADTLVAVRKIGGRASGKWSIHQPWESGQPGWKSREPPIGNPPGQPCQPFKSHPGEFSSRRRSREPCEHFPHPTSLCFPSSQMNCQLLSQLSIHSIDIYNQMRFLIRCRVTPSIRVDVVTHLLLSQRDVIFSGCNSDSSTHPPGPIHSSISTF